MLPARETCSRPTRYTSHFSDVFEVSLGVTRFLPSDLRFFSDPVRMKEGRVALNQVKGIEMKGIVTIE